jgi:hypothetical protein
MRKQLFFCHLFFLDDLGGVLFDGRLGGVVGEADGRLDWLIFVSERSNPAESTQNDVFAFCCWSRATGRHAG